jgi:heptose-I-phosphate ethanolaminephosphotransferase
MPQTTLSSLLSPLNRAIKLFAKGLPLFALYLFLLSFAQLCHEDAAHPLTALNRAATLSTFSAIIFTLWSVNHRILRASLIALLSLLSLLDLYCLYHHDCRFNATILQLILSTDTAEAGEYFNNYLLTAKTASALLTVVIPVAAMLTLQHFWRKSIYPRLAALCRRWLSKSSPRRVKALNLVIAYLALLIFLRSALYCCSDLSLNQLLPIAAGASAILSLGYATVVRLFRPNSWRKANVIATALSVVMVILGAYPMAVGKNIQIASTIYNSLQSIPVAVAVVDDNYLDISRFTQTNSQVVVDSASPDRFKIIVMIGESFNKHHAPQYGYQLNTMPRLSAESDSNLFVFTDAVSPYRQTAQAMLDLMSTKSLSDSTAWEDNPIFPAIFRKAGWHIALMDNQYVKNASESFNFSCSYFYSTDKMSRLCFDRRNDFMYDFDSQIIDDCLEKFADNDMLIVHFRGQHVQAAQRFPKGFGSFTAPDYTSRSDLDDTRRQTLADYDNATLFQDQNIATIIDRFRDDDTIVIFFSDHGEEIYDFRDQYGRTQGEITPDIAHCMSQVPYFVWVSNAFRHRHPDKVAAIARAVNYPIRNTDLPHVLLDLAGIHTATFNPRLSWLNDNYDTRLQRPLDCGSTYEQIINRK